MYEEETIIKRVLTAQHNIDEADNLIRDYFPFIKSETAKVIGKIPVEGKDDELSIALMGFHEAIESYEEGKGTFLKFASLVIKRRIIDFCRQEERFKQDLSWEASLMDEEHSEAMQKPNDEEIVNREALKWEISQLNADLEYLGITISEIAANSPKYDKSIAGCRKAIEYLISHPEQMKTMFETGKLPINKIVEETSVRKKTLEKHRKYLMALAVIYFKEYDCMINHLSEVFKLKEGGKCR